MARVANWSASREAIVLTNREVIQSKKNTTENRIQILIAFYSESCIIR